MSLEPTKRFRSRLKSLLIDNADRWTGRSGTMELPVEQLRPHRLPRPDPRQAMSFNRRPQRPIAADSPILITGRFRAGTTLVWNLFRQASGVTAYYEPFNERCWVDPSKRGSGTDPSHRGVEEYWSEYADLEGLTPLFRRRWHERNLFMNTDARDPDMERYVRALIERAPTRPVLQFNRIDFRLPWFHRTFPDAAIVHVVRNPRDQWCSTLIDPTRFGSNEPAEGFTGHDGFYLRLWIDRLQPLVPTLTAAYQAHPYRAFYLLWRMSQIFGLAWADLSLSFERLVDDPHTTVTTLFDTVGVDTASLPASAAVVESQSVRRWPEYADDDWFTSHEDVAEKHLEELLG